ncbi:mitochondrial 37S ribosomal protein uS2m MRP4 PWA37_002423 [Arxiozyma heterogenica]|uniref:mitochondrial 37S ribosomal protein uS2m MRP4 n=1 Tax=Arxiozyma heterogenica TaxID=278026 RepID=UPI002F0BD1D6
MLKLVSARPFNKLYPSTLSKRFNHVSSINSENTLTNESIVNRLKSLRYVNTDEEQNIRNLLNQPLNDKELQLDEELTKFLEEFKHLKEQQQQVLANNNNTNRSLTGPFTTSSTTASTTTPFPYLKSVSKSNEPYSLQELYLRQLNHARVSASLGAQIKDTYQPHMDITCPPSVEETTIQKLMAANVHLGQSTSLYRSSTQSFIYGEYKGLHIIDLNQTLQYLKRACSIVEGVAENGGIILLLGTRPQWKVPLQTAARRMNGYFVSTRWIPGTLTNPTELSRIWDKQEIDQFDVPTGRTLTNDEMSCIVKPDLLIVLNPTENRNALYEAMKTRVPTIGIIDTDSEPSMVTYPIPGNDDSNRSVNLLLGILSRAGERGLNKRLKKNMMKGKNSDDATI